MPKLELAWPCTLPCPGFSSDSVNSTLLIWLLLRDGSAPGAGPGLSAGKWMMSHMASGPWVGHVHHILVRIKGEYCCSYRWDRVNFLSSSWYCAVFWIWDEKNVNNTLIFCCWEVLTLSQGLFIFLHCPASKETRGAQEVGNGQNQDSWP